MLAGEGGGEDRVGGLVDEGAAVFAEGADEAGDLGGGLLGRGLSCAKDEKGRERTLFFLMAASRHLKLSGFLSLAQTKTCFLPAGTAKGPMPAMTSHTTSPGRKMLISLRCSVSSLLFQ